MTSLRSSSRAGGRLFLTLICAALAMKAFIPAGYMIAPSANHIFAVTPCPSTNPLAHLAGDAASQHAAMGHAAMGHAAMGHGPSDPQDKLPVSAQSNIDCAFSALTFGATFPGKPHFFVTLLDIKGAAGPFQSTIIVVRNRYLRPPLRAPPPAV